MRYKHHLQTICLLVSAVLLLAYNDDPPNGRTGAPFDGSCRDCHVSNNPGGYNGIAKIIGLPDTILPNTTYSLQLKATVTAGNPIRAGFQLVFVDKNNINAGNLTAINNESDTEFFNGREYLDQRNGKYFNGAPVSWNFEWTSPASTPCNEIRVYYIVNFCNGGGDFGDYSIAFADALYFSGSAPLDAHASTLQNNSCVEDAQGIVEAQSSGGTLPYQYQWSNGASGSTLSGLPNGTYAVTIVDSNNCVATDSTLVSSLDTIIPQLICPSSISTCAGDTVHYNLPTLEDNCAVDSSQLILQNGYPSGTVFPIGTTQLVFQASDASANTATCSVTIQVNTLPVVQLDSILHDTNNSGTGQILVTTQEGTGGPITFTWEKEGLFFSQDTSDLTGLYAGNYGLVVSDSLGCSTTLPMLQVSNTVGSHGHAEQSASFSTIPNPISGTSFYIHGILEQPKAISLINLHGQTVDFFSASAWPGPFNIEMQPAGWYFLKIITAAGRVRWVKVCKG